jgi:serine/threonine protein kinase/predicted negative regulator of RcsB-dependent stress response
VSVSIADFWKILAESRLLVPQQVQQLAGEFGQIKAAATPTGQTLAQWLVSRNVLSRYQATILLAGRSGPFYYGEYKVYDRVEKGTLAGCFRAVHATTGHPVLLRFLTGDVVSQPQLWQAAAGSVWTASRIVSPHVQRYFEPVDLQTFKFVVSDDLRGTALDEQLTRGRVPPGEACRLARLMALALASMHAAGRVHGDLRPANVLLEAMPKQAAGGKQPANAKLLFDVLQTPGPIDLSDQQPTGRLAVMADWLAPELLASGRPCDALSDIYALGSTLYAMVAGGPPFAGATLQEKLTRRAKEGLPSLESLGVPPALAQVVANLTAKKPAARCQSALGAAEQLAKLLQPAVLQIEPPAPPPTLAAYEQVMQQRHTAPTPVGVVPATVAGGAIGVGGKPLVQTDRDRFAALATGIGPKSEAAPAAAAASGASPFAFSHSSPTLSPAITAAAASSEVAVASPAAVPELNVTVGRKPRSSRSSEEILRRRKAQQRRNMLVGLAAIALLAAGGAGGWWYYSTHRASGEASVAAVEQAVPTVTEASATALPTKTHAAEKDGGAGSLTLVSDDGKTLWASPTAGQPIEFRLVPPEGQVFLIVRPAALLANPEGSRVLAAFGPALAAQRQAFETASGLKLEEIEQLHITLHNNDAKFPRVSFVVKTKEPQAKEQLLAKWANPAATKEGSETYYTGSAWAYYIPSAAEDAGKFAMGDARDIKDVAAEAGKPPPLFREIERLRRSTDGDRPFTLLFFPQFLFNDDGEPLFAGELARLRQPLAWLLGDHLQAGCVSASLGDEFYFEMRMLASLDKEPFQLAEEMRERLNKSPRLLEDYFVTISPPRYWNRLAFRYPSMVRELHSQMRVGVENEQAIVNSVLPAMAAHNLVLGGELLISTAPGQLAAATASTAPAAAAGPKTINEALQLKTSYSFDNQSLEFAMRDLADDVQSNLKGASFEFAIKIIGDDLKIDGITRNQSIRDFKQENQTVADVLTALVRKANPITTVKDPSETDQKLIWVIGPDPDDASKQIVLITTRAAAAAKKYTLPEVFVAKK